MPRAKAKAKERKQKAKVRVRITLHDLHLRHTQNPSHALPLHLLNEQRVLSANSLTNAQVDTMVATAHAINSIWHRQKHKHTSARIRPKSIRSRPTIAHEPTRLIDDDSVVAVMILPIRIITMAPMCQHRIQACIITVAGLRTV